MRCLSLAPCSPAARLLVCLLALLAACSGSEPEPAPIVAVPPGTATPPGQVPVPPTPQQPAPAAPSCIEGRWEANDFLAELRRGLRADMRDARLTRASGTIHFTLGPLDATGAGELVATADELVHRATIGRGALRASLTHRLSGGSTMPYRLPTVGQMLILPPTEGELSGRATVRIGGGKGRRAGRPRSEPVNFTGLYTYDCSPERLVIRRVLSPGQFGDMLVLDRAEVTPEAQ